MSVATRFGPYGGRFVPESLIPALEELTRAYEEARADEAFQAELARLLADYAGRPTPLYHAARLSERCGAAIYLKREDLCHTGAHKINNVLGQALLAVRMGKRRVIAETGAGQHGVATATACALLGLECVVYMGAEDIRRQELNVVRMRLLGATVAPVESGSRTLKDAMNEALRDWVTNVRGTFYVIGSVAGPAPYPAMVRDFQQVIGTRRASSCSRASAACPTRSSPAWAAAPTPWASSRPFATTRCASPGSRRPATASTPSVTAPRSRAAVPACCTARSRYLLQDAWGQVARGALGLGRPRLPGRGARARLAQRQRPRRLCGRHRRRGPGRLSA